MALLAHPCASVADERAAARLYSLLRPLAHVYAVAPVEGVFGAIARGLGGLAARLQRYDDAERHFVAAIELERRMGARPWLAHAQHDLAAMLVARDDPERAGPHLDAALETYGELGMETWAARASALR
jgi:tetratricopeptide (TPR) repeat protein